MIAKIWSMGITVEYNNSRWFAYCEWKTGDHGKPGHLEGEIKTSYGEETIDFAIDCVRKQAKRMNVVFVALPGENPDLYYAGDGNNSDCPPPENWLAILREAAAKIGFSSYPWIKDGAELQESEA